MNNRYAGRTVIAFLVCFSSYSTFSQNNTVSAGSNVTNSNGIISDTIGQVFYLFGSNTDNSTNDGLQQPFEFSTLNIQNPTAEPIIVMLYPNPTVDDIHLKLTSPAGIDYRYVISDLNGRMVGKGIVRPSLTEISMQTLASTTYILTVTGSNRYLKTFKIIKK